MDIGALPSASGTSGQSGQGDRASPLGCCRQGCISIYMRVLHHPTISKSKSTSAKEASFFEANAAALLKHIHRPVVLKAMKARRPMITPSMIMITVVWSSLLEGLETDS